MNDNLKILSGGAVIVFLLSGGASAFASAFAWTAAMVVKTVVAVSISAALLSVAYLLVSRYSRKAQESVNVVFA